MGVILGPMAEGYFLTSMVSSGNDPSVFVTRPVSAVLLALSVLIVVWPLLRTARRKRMLSGQRSEGEEATSWPR
jgi:putative tricarboxylic transport membrane protein